MFVKFTKWLHESGAIRKWFAWMEGLTLAAVFIAVGWKSDFLPVMLLGGFSVFLLWCSAIYTTTELVGNYLSGKIPKWLGLPIAFTISLTFPAAILAILFMAITALITST